MHLTIHRGTREVGGSCVELRCGSARVVIDLGMPLVRPGGADGEEYDHGEFRELSGPELVERGILPPVAGLYEWDSGSPPVDGLLISHPHQDHYGFTRYLRADVPTWMGAATRALIEVSMLFTPAEARMGDGRTFKSGEPFSCGPFIVTPYLQDHSGFDSHGFLVEAAGRRLYYSGDFRGHGRKSKLLYATLNKLPKGMDALLLEGTMMGRTSEDIPTEEDLENRAVELLAGRDRPALVYASGQNIDRLVTLFRAVRKTRRLLVVDPYVANVLKAVGKFSDRMPQVSDPRFPELKVWYPDAQRRMWKRKGIFERICYPFAGAKLTKEQISENASRVVLMARPGIMRDLEKVDGLRDGVLLYSMWDGYRKKERTAALLRWVKERGFEEVTLHTSGHAAVDTLKRVVRKLEPSVVVPIHTFHPQRFEELGAPVRLLRDGEVMEV